MALPSATVASLYDHDGGVGGLLLKRRKGRRGRRERSWGEKQKIKGPCCLFESRGKCPAKTPLRGEVEGWRETALG